MNHSAESESGSFEHGRLTIRASTLKHLIAAAYEIRVDLVTGGPSWIDVDRFDVEAKADPNTSEHMSRVMLQRLLSERLKLTVHRQKKQRQVLVLTIAKSGPKLTRSGEDPSVRSRCFGTHPLTCTKRTMAEFADVLPRISSGIETPVVDETGLDGRYDITLMFAQPNPRGQAETASESLARPQSRNEDVSIFEAVQTQLGLKLKGAERPVEFLVIDRVDRVPAEN